MSGGRGVGSGLLSSTSSNGREEAAGNRCVGDRGKRGDKNAGLRAPGRKGRPVRVRRRRPRRRRRRRRLQHGVCVVRLGQRLRVRRRRSRVERGSPPERRGAPGGGPARAVHARAVAPGEGGEVVAQPVLLLLEVLPLLTQPHLLVHQRVLLLVHLPPLLDEVLVLLHLLLQHVLLLLHGLRRRRRLDHPARLRLPRRRQRQLPRLPLRKLAGDLVRGLAERAGSGLLLLHHEREACLRLRDAVGGAVHALQRLLRLRVRLPLAVLLRLSLGACALGAGDLPLDLPVLLREQPLDVAQLLLRPLHLRLLRLQAPDGRLQQPLPLEQLRLPRPLRVLRRVQLRDPVAQLRARALRGLVRQVDGLLRLRLAPLRLRERRGLRGQRTLRLRRLEAGGLVRPLRGRLLLPQLLQDAARLLDGLLLRQVRPVVLRAVVQAVEQGGVPLAEAAELLHADDAVAVAVGLLEEVVDGGRREADVEAAENDDEPLDVHGVDATHVELSEERLHLDLVRRAVGEHRQRHRALRRGGESLR
eukprot:Rhum_TRINITY_DN11570_c0_g1::Rhum_TRINITY_DN11570_c0_g1_i1::g.45419::m.45419